MIDALKVIGGYGFLIVVPLFCLFLLQRARARKIHMPFLGWALFIIGGLMAILTAVTYIPDLFNPEIRKYEGWEVFAFWFIPPVIIACAGWALRKRVGSSPRR